MKQNLGLFFALILLGITTNIYAEEKKKIKSSLQTATVFFQGAELIHTANATLTRGENEIYIDGLSPIIDRNSLKINASNGAIITAFEYSIDYLNEKQVSASGKKLLDSIAIYTNNIKDCQVKLQTNTDLLGLLQANKSIAGTQNGLSVAELMKMMDYYEAKSVQLQNEKSQLEDKIEKSTYRIAILQNQYEQESAKNIKTSGILKLNLTSPTTTNSTFTITYFTAASGWTPYYDINVGGIDKPIKLTGKAKVRQTTGLDWNKVKLTLSTSAPSNGKVAPLFNSWFLSYQSYSISPRMNKSMELMAQNSYSYDMVEELAVPSIDMKLEGKVAGLSRQNNEPQRIYIVDGVSMSEDDFSNIDQSMIKNIDASNRNRTIVTLKNSMDDYVTRDENQLNMVYNIDLPYTVEGNGKEQVIDLQSMEVPAEFSYYSVPKLDSETFLIAEISNWERLGLLTGKANVTFEGTYVGETIIDAGSTLSKLSLTLGTDKRVAVKREKMQDYSSKKFLGNDIKQEFIYQITVKNNQSKTIKMVLKDQYPLTTQKDIEVELSKEITPTTHRNEDVGVLVWEFDLAPGETKTFTNAYNVKYPKDKNLNL